MAEYESLRHFILYGDGSVAQVVGIPRETIDEDGIREIVFELRPRPSVIRLHKLRYPEDYDDLKNQTIKRKYYVADTLFLGTAPVNKRFVRLLKMLNELDYLFKPMMGGGKFEELKESIESIVKQNKNLLSVVKITENPRTEFQYFAF